MEDVLTVYKIDANFVYGLFFKKKNYSCLKESVLLEVSPALSLRLDVQKVCLQFCDVQLGFLCI